ncbi:N-glycosidase YbiA [Aplysia californica]|uniref:N-glycosidase YbiA n=1 Tax=Aplysia californica TaxID=6500 RepID=A0ABM1ABN2_APLCA|nr:N-glycosidase YbiA [Aplysia californica]XP_005110450.1 N-glycosidase YbiA [Aplysia californica]XP_012944619.1 N-glycosidase YbiA [Aplysia californica]
MAAKDEMKSKTCKADGVDNKETFHCFFGKASPFSQHHPAKFEIDGIIFNCAEQYMMYSKAVQFKDEEMKKKILGSSNPVEQKRFGRKVKNFEKDVWTSKAEDIVRTATLAKFEQNEDLRKQLLATYPATLVEASPRDRIWGIGLGLLNPKAQNRATWRGKNKLGQILTAVRDELLDDEREDPQ